MFGAYALRINFCRKFQHAFKGAIVNFHLQHLHRLGLVAGRLRCWVILGLSQLNREALQLL